MENQTIPSSVKKEDKNKFVIFLAIAAVVIIIISIIGFVLSRNNSAQENTAVLPENTCPEEIKNEDDKVKAVYKGETVEMSLGAYDWVQKNCDLDGSDSAEDPVITNLGVEFGNYDEMTGRSGAFIFDKEALKTNIPSNKIFFEFGATLVTEDGSKQFPEIVYNQVDADSDISAIADGIVFQIETQDESSDYAVVIRYNENWLVIYDHVRELQVELGDEVKAGDVIGKVSLNKDGITGYTEISLKSGDGKGDTYVHCITNYLAKDVKEVFEEKLTLLMKDWESYYGDDTIYSEESQVAPGCLAQSFIAK